VVHFVWFSVVVQFAWMYVGVQFACLYLPRAFADLCNSMTKRASTSGEMVTIFTIVAWFLEFLGFELTTNKHTQQQQQQQQQQQR
jgi:hypothetical protein